MHRLRDGWLAHRGKWAESHGGQEGNPGSKEALGDNGRREGVSGDVSGCALHDSWRGGEEDRSG